MRYTINIFLVVFTGLFLLPESMMSQDNLQKELSIKGKISPYGIAGQQAPELNVTKWVDALGNATEAFNLADHKNKFTVLYCFQAWCPGCHSRGLPALKEMSTALKDNPNVTFAAIQTVFEGAHANTYERLLEIQKQYGLEIPFGHNTPVEGQRLPSVMQQYQTGGTPWFIFIDQEGQVVFNDFHLNTKKAIAYLKTLQ
jgi:thiol-disulfide isomerase/thioredoxin